MVSFGMILALVSYVIGAVVVALLSMDLVEESGAGQAAAVLAGAFWPVLVVVGGTIWIVQCVTVKSK